MDRRRRRSLTSSDKIAKYEIRQVLHSHGECSLLEAYDPFLDRIVAIKVIQLYSPDVELEPVSLNQFFAEARAIGRLQHQNIVAVYDAGLGDYEGYLVMEYVQGYSLLKVLDEQGSVPVDLLREAVPQYLDALAYAHKKGVIHRDLKPSNLMLTTDNIAKLVDFGISRIDGSDGEERVALAGSPSYMAPELLMGELPTIQSDIFSFGVVLYQALCGELPFTAEQPHAVLFKIMNEVEIDLRERLGWISENFAQLVHTCLRKDPAQRFADANALKTAFARL